MNLRHFSLTWLFWLAGTTAISTASFIWFDAPIALFFHDRFRYRHYELVDELSHFPNPLILLASILLIALSLQIVFGRPLSKHQANAFLCSLSIIFTEAIKNSLKYIFGRTWPETWIDNNLSYIRDGVYGFHFLHGGTAYQSFPSGHMATVCAIVPVLWVRYPRFRTFYAIAVVIVGTLLVGGNYHFLSDVIAGAFIGLSIGSLGIQIWNACADRGLIPDATAIQKLESRFIKTTRTK